MPECTQGESTRTSGGSEREKKIIKISFDRGSVKINLAMLRHFPILENVMSLHNGILPIFPFLNLHI